MTFPAQIEAPVVGVAVLLVALMAVALAAGAAVPAAAQVAPQDTAQAAQAAEALGPTAASMGAELLAAQRSHLWRVLIWGAASLVAGLAVLFRTRPEQAGWRGFAIQTALWGVINLGIVGWAFRSGLGDPATALVPALAAEDGYGNILLLNLGLNIGYMAVGLTLALAAGYGLARPRTVRGHGLGLVVQGLGLLVLDWVAYTASRTRIEILQGLLDRVLG